MIPHFYRHCPRRITITVCFVCTYIHPVHKAVSRFHNFSFLPATRSDVWTNFRNIKVLGSFVYLDKRRDYSSLRKSHAFISISTSITRWEMRGTRRRRLLRLARTKVAPLFSDVDRHDPFEKFETSQTRRLLAKPWMDQGRYGFSQMQWFIHAYTYVVYVFLTASFEKYSMISLKFFVRYEFYNIL